MCGASLGQDSEQPFQPASHQAVVPHSSRTQDSCSSGKDKKLHVVPVWSKVPQWGQKHTMFVQEHVYYALVLEPGLGPSGSLEPQELPASTEPPSINGFKGCKVGVWLCGVLVRSATSPVLPSPAPAGYGHGVHIAKPTELVGSGKESACVGLRWSLAPCLPAGQPLTLPGDIPCPSPHGTLSWSLSHRGTALQQRFRSG